MRSTSLLILIATCACLKVTSARAQATDSTVNVAIGFGVDTVGSPNHEIFALWRSYLLSAPSCQRPSSAWSASERARYPVGDLLCSYVYQGFHAFTVVHLAPAVGLDSTFLVRTLVASVSDSGRAVLPLALYRVYGTRENGRWVLANALPRVTRRWNHQRIGRVTFVFPDGRPFRRGRAAATASFVDSLARAFEVAPPDSIDYYFTDDLVEALRAAGLEYFPLASDTVGGRADALDHIVLVGSSANGEGYRHEVAHVVLWPFLASLHPAGLVLEGLMTWVGGAAGLTYRQLMPGLQQYLLAHPSVTLDSILTRPPVRVGSLDVGYDGLAVLCHMVFDAAGLRGIRRLADAGRQPNAVLDTAAAVLTVARPQLDERWRAEVATLASQARPRHGARPN